MVPGTFSAVTGRTAWLARTGPAGREARAGRRVSRGGIRRHSPGECRS